MILLYVTLIKKGLRTIEQVPEIIRDKVVEKLEGMADAEM